MAKTRACIGAAAAALIAAQAHAASANAIGSVSAANNAVNGTPPAATPQLLSIGDDVVSDERIESSEIGSGQFLFLDNSSITVAPNSNIVLDKYVYDPASKTGEFAMSMSKGVMRFIGGRITKTRDAVVTTPTATIGIRGGMSIIIVDPDGTTRVMHIAGEYTKLTTLGGEEIVISRSNGVALVTSGGEIDYLGVANQDLIRETTLALIGRGEAGEKIKPEELDVIQSRIPGSNSEAKNAATDPPISTTGESEPGFNGDERRTKRTDEEIATPIATSQDRTPRPNPGPTRVLLPGVTGGASIGAQGYTFAQVFQGSRIGVTVDGEEFVIPTEAGPFRFGFADGGLAIGDAISGVGYFDPEGEFTYAVFSRSDGVNGAFLAGKVSDPLPAASNGGTTLRSYRVSTDLGNGATPFMPRDGGSFPRSGVSDLTLISNPGASSSGGDAKAVATYLDIGSGGASFGVFTANVDTAKKGTPAFNGAFEGSYAGSGGVSRVHTPVATVEDGGGGSAFGPGAQHLALSNSPNLGGEAGNLAFTSSPTGATAFFSTHNVATRDKVETLAAASRAALPSGTLNGYAATTGVDMGAGLQYYGYNDSPDAVSLSIDPATNSMTATIGLNNFETGTDEFPEIFNAAVYFGGKDGKSAVVSDRKFAARDQTNGPNTANFFGSAPDAFSGALASADLAGDGGVFPAGVTPRSKFLTWGWWAGEIRADGPQEPCEECSTPLTNDQRFHIGTFVAGQISSNIPTTGVASFDGFAAVSTIVDGARVVDGAGFGLTYDFGERVGAAKITDILGANATVAVNGGVDSAGYLGTGGVTISGRDGVIGLKGGFFDGRNGAPARATAGTVTLRTNDGGIRGAGVFAADRK